jgi:hypothetical protein
MGTHEVGTRFMGRRRMGAEPGGHLRRAAQRCGGSGGGGLWPPAAAWDPCPLLCAAAIALHARQETRVWCNASGYFGDRIFGVTSRPQSSVHGTPSHVHSLDALCGQVMWRGHQARNSDRLPPSRRFAQSEVDRGQKLRLVLLTKIGQASEHGIWAYHGSKPFIHNGRLWSSMGVNGPERRS